jgi:hypothetical protein
MKALLLTFVISFLIILQATYAQDVYLKNSDYYIVHDSQLTYYKNNTMTHSDTLFFTLKTDISNYEKKGYVIHGLIDEIEAGLPVHGTCYYIDFNGNQIHMIEYSYSLGWFYNLSSVVQVPVIPLQTIKYSIYCISPSNTNYGNISMNLGALPASFGLPLFVPSDKTKIVIRIEKSYFLPFFEKYYNLNWVNKGDLDFSLDNSDKDFYILNVDFTNPAQRGTIVILYNHYFDWNSWLSDNLLSAIWWAIIGVALDKGYKQRGKIKMIPSYIKKKIYRKSTPPSQQHPSEPSQPSPNRQNKQ